jgi:DNA-binding MarR family transcriptional regulator
MKDHDLITQWGLVVEAVSAINGVAEHDLQEHDQISMPTFEVLLRLSRTPGHRLQMSDLAGGVSFSSGGFTKFADRLEDAGLVKRQPCTNDRRVTWVELTPHGSAIAARASAQHASVLRDRLLGVLSETELLELGRMMRTIRDSVRPTSSALPVE